MGHLALRVFTQQNELFSTYSREFTHPDTLYLTKFNNSTIEPRGTMLAEVIGAERASKQDHWLLNAPRAWPTAS
jgi:hypothetical protein